MREVKADAEHQQHDPDLRELEGHSAVGDESRRERPDRDAREQVSDERGQAKPLRRDPAHEGSGKRDRDGLQEFAAVFLHFPRPRRPTGKAPVTVPHQESTGARRRAESWKAPGRGELIEQVDGQARAVDVVAMLRFGAVLAFGRLAHGG